MQRADRKSAERWLDDFLGQLQHHDLRGWQFFPEYPYSVRNYPSLR